MSIITPTFNDIKYIEDTYKSICSQQYKNWEWVITDDFSSDGTFELLEEISKKDSRISLFRNHVNLGAAVSRNNSIKFSKGRFIAFLDADDLWEKGKLEKQIEFMVSNNIALSYSDYSVIDDDGKELSIIRQVPNYVTYDLLLRENIIGCLTAVYDVEKVGKVYMPPIRKRQDFGLWLNILRDVNKAYKCEGVLAKYRLRSKSVSSNKFVLLRYNFELFYKYERMPAYKASYYVLSNMWRKIKRITE
ncbi:glycosyltransferase family 2 protein [Vibrio thalassae]|uniref:glycosyltransferase family 2 protein n=1 Tax=Vibrio thalassae TaxID=1243014 RepID=UPI001ABFDC40|nr:glycosyltransferase family 2 protein [Vibrio thalassae]